jgi:hypothetical protein
VAPARRAPAGAPTPQLAIARRRRLGWFALVAPLAITPPAEAEVHGSFGAGPALLLTGRGGDATRWSVAGELTGSGRLGGGLALSGVGGRGEHGVVTARLSAQVAAAPPKLWLRLHGEAGVALAARDPVVGGGATATLRLWHTFALIVDGNAHLVVRDVEATRLTVSVAALLGAAW